MPKKKIKIGNQKPREAKKENFFTQLHLGESYMSLLLGIIVVIVAAILLIGFVQTKSVNISKQASPQIASQKTDKFSELKKEQALTYTVADGDTLWSIAENVYKSGFDWREIAKANKIEDPTDVKVGTKLIVPNIKVAISDTKSAIEETKENQTKDIAADVKTTVEEKAPAQKQEENIPSKITANSYTVVKGDTLWDIAVRAYGDGFQWEKIAKANNLANPGLIHSGNEFVIPR